MEGRDIGTAVFPDAEVKIFLDAHPTVRAERRILQERGSRPAADPQRVVEELAARDERDRTRTTSPLRPASDAVVVDTSGKRIEEVVDEVVRIVAARK